MAPYIKDLSCIDTLETLRQVTEDGDSVLAWASTVRTVKVVKQGKELSYFPAGICQFVHLSKLDLSGNALTSIPFTIRGLCSLEVLNLSGNDLACLPPELGDLHGLVELDVSKNCLLKLPDSVCNLTNLKVLNAYSNKMTSLPGKFGKLTALKRLGLKSNKLQTLPDSFTKLSNLVELFITDNVLEAFPTGVGQLSSLVKLQASFNCFKSIPEEVMALPRLEMIRVAVCQIESLPSELMLKGSSHLAWCSLGGNPAFATLAAPEDFPQVDLNELELGALLGDGASGSVYSSHWRGQEVAVKVFRSDVSPDGRTEEEVAISCAVKHPNLVSVLAVSPEPRGLVLPLVRGAPLADKPTFEPLLRCRWSEGLQIPLPRLLRIAGGLASALEYLHSRHICHGDVYAHNVLVDEEGNATLCDFGASYCYPSSERYWQAMEVRAFGLFLKDMLDRVQGGAISHPDISQLWVLVEDCVDSPPATRTTFSTIKQVLTAMQGN